MSDQNDDFSTEEVLNYLVECGTLDLAGVCRDMDMDNDRKYLNMHDNKIWQRKDGSYCTHLPNEKRQLIVRKKKVDLERAIIQYYKASEDRPTVENVFYRWLEDRYKYKEISKGTYDRYENDFKRFFTGTGLINMQVAKVSEDELEDFIRESIVEHGLSAKGFSGLKTIVNGIFKYAKKKKYTDMSISYFFSDLDIPKRTFKSIKKSPEEQVFSEDEIPHMLEYIDDNITIENLGLKFALLTGIRSGELTAVKYSDITGNELHIQRQEIIYKGDTSRKNIHEIVDYTKTEAGNLCHNSY